MIIRFSKHIPFRHSHTHKFQLTICVVRLLNRGSPLTYVGGRGMFIWEGRVVWYPCSDGACDSCLGVDMRVYAGVFGE